MVLRDERVSLRIKDPRRVLRAQEPRVCVRLWYRPSHFTARGLGGSQERACGIDLISNSLSMGDPLMYGKEVVYTV